jgi:HD-like signal output (HDOD) protein/FixJ family two-component response regulator
LAAIEKTGPCRILVVDDEEPVRVALRRQLGLQGHQIFDAPGGAQGLVMVSAHQPQVILLDLRMPEMDGKTFLQRLAAARCDAAVVVISGHGSMADVVDVVNAGVVDFLAKPWTQGELTAAIAHARSCYDDRQRQLAEEDARQAAAGAEARPGLPHPKPAERPPRSGGIVDTLERLRRGETLLPAVPAVLQRLRTLLADPDTAITAVVAEVQHDQRLAAEVLRVASSAYQSTGGAPPTDLTAAVTRVGLRRVHTLAEAAFLQGFCNVNDPRGKALLTKLWQESLARAEAMRMLAKTVSPAAHSQAETCYLIGLFDDVGAALLLWMEATRQSEQPFAAREEACLSLIRAHHQDLGAMMLGQWQIAPVVTESVQVHHGTQPPGKYLKEWALGVVASDLIQRLAPGQDFTAREPFPAKVVEEASAQLKLGEPARQDVLLRLVREHGKIGTLLR